MELAMELVVSALIAIALSFLIAKLVSAILASDGGEGADKRIVMEELRLRSGHGGEGGSGVVEEAVRGDVKEVVRFGGGEATENDSVEACGFEDEGEDESEAVDLSVEQSSMEESSFGVLEREVELVKELKVSSGLDCLVGEEEGVEKIDDDQEIEVCSSTRGFGVPERGEIGVSGCEEENQRGGNEEIGVMGCEEEEDGRSGGNDEIGVVGREGEDRKIGRNEEIGVAGCEEGDWKSGGIEGIGVVVGREEEDLKSGGSEEIGVVRCEDESEKSAEGEEIGVVGCEGESEKSGGGEDGIGVVRCEEGVDEGRRGVEEEVRIDDDWEGIERSELERVFAAAANYVASGDHGLELGGVGSDVEMELYGLHKVATEGPCRESQPMALRVSARAYWNAWQRLGNMNPDVAMERYVALLSEKIPGWTKDNHAGDSKRDLFQEGATSKQDPKSSTFPRHEPNLTDERKPEINSAVEGDHLTETSHVVEKVKE